MQHHFLMIGFGSKDMYVTTALAQGARLTLIIARDKFNKQYQYKFHQVHMVDDVYDWPSLSTLVAKINAEHTIDAVLTRYEAYVSVVGAINEHLGLSGISYQTARNFSNKYLMKKQWEAAGVPCAAVAVVDQLSGNLESISTFLDTHQFPLILKKTTGAHSKFVMKVHSKQELLEQIEFLEQQIAPFIMGKPLQGYVTKSESAQEPKIIVEEFLHGRELTVDSFVSNGVYTHMPFCEYVLAHELGVDDSYLPIRSMPTSLSHDARALILTTVERAIRALGAQNCVCHTELFFDEQNNACWIIESTPRGGGHRSEMSLISSGYDYNLAVFQATAGLPLAPCNVDGQVISVVEFFAEHEGRVRALDLDFLSQHPMVSQVNIKCKKGELVNQAQLGGKVLVNFFVVGGDYEQNRQVARQLFTQVRTGIQIDSL